jgi:hypothetical protein
LLINLRITVINEFSAYTRKRHGWDCRRGFTIEGLGMILPNFQINGLLQHQRKIDGGVGAASDFKGHFLEVMAKAFGLDEKKGIKKIPPESIKQSRGHELIEMFKKYLISQDISLDTKVVGEEAFESLEQLLMDAGFGKESVAKLIERLKTVSGTQGLKLTDLFTSLNELKETESDSEHEGRLAISALPYIESILSLFGLEPDTIHKVLDGAKKESNFIDTDRLVSNLKNTVPDFPKVFDSLPDDKAQNKILKMMNSLGMDVVTPEKGKITLEKFITQLQAMTAAKSYGASSDKILAEDFNALIAHIQTKQDNGIKENKANLFARNLSIASSVSKETTFGSFYKSNRTHERSSIEEENVKETKNWTESSRVSKNSETLLKAEEIRTLKSNKADAFSLEGQIKEGKGTDAPAAGFGKIAGGKTLPAYVMDQVGRQILNSLKSGSNEVKLQLKPPSLGRLKLTIENSGDGFKVRIFTEQRATKEMLLSHAGEIKSSLADQGLRIEKIDVQISNNFDQSMTNARQESNKFYDQRHSGDKEPGESETGPSVPETAILVKRTDSILDLVA